MAASSRIEQIQDTLVKARDELSKVDENIKKVTGRDPSEFRRFGPGRFNRGGRMRRLSSRDGDQPPAKRFAGGSGPEIRSFGVAAGGGNPPGSDARVLQGANAVELRPRRDSMGEDREDDQNKPSIQSSVVAKAGGARRESVSERPEDKDRNRRMFGQLMGTLNKFKTEAQTTAAKQRHRQQIENRLEEEAQKEREEIAQERRQLFNVRRVKQRELRKLEQQVNLFELSQAWQAHGQEICSGSFIRLKASPSLFYKPKEHNETTEKLVVETRESIESETEARRKDIEVLIADMEQVVPMEEERKSHEEGGKGGSVGGGSLGPGEGGQEEDVLMRNVGEEGLEEMEGEGEGVGVDDQAEAAAATGKAEQTVQNGNDGDGSVVVDIDKASVEMKDPELPSAE
ncbi:pinin-like [Corticium candelabrum]|uniref:pinin-like n=1 Tax=Corticium candelabrum TaxID=121492 RepID=UPI002E275669|nr:pinin-like [Corticium candelabrum]